MNKVRKEMRVVILCFLVLAAGFSVQAQDEEEEPAPVTTPAPVADVEEVDTEAGAGDEDETVEEECEEAWNYLEFLKESVKENIEHILQDVLFQQQSLLETTVADAMSEVMVIRDALLDRTKAIRTGDETIVICPEQNIKQEEFLTELRMDVMSVLLKLIEEDAATSENVKNIGRMLLTIRTKVNGKITQIIMLREAKAGSAVTSDEDCDCGILSEVLEGIDNVVEKEKARDSANGDEEAQASEESPVSSLTMTLMLVDNRIGVLYNDILAQLDEEKRNEATEELRSLKGISQNLNNILSDLAGDSVNPAKAKRVLTRDAVRLRNDVEQLLNKCREKCNECNSCGADKIDEVLYKLQDYNISLQTLEEEDAKESVRSDLMSYLGSANEDMKRLLTAKVESPNGTLEDCDKETLEVIQSLKGPLWMLVNITIFGDGGTMNEMINALESALMEMRSKYCASDSSPAPTQVEDNQCDLEEINSAGQWISEIDQLISDNLFKAREDDGDDGRIGAMLGFVELKSNMDDRVRQLFQENLVCKEEVEQIKNVYSDNVTKCLAEMMSPKYRFEQKTRAEKVQCIKQLRVTIEDRRGELLMREIERRIKENSVGGDDTNASDNGGIDEDATAGETAAAQQ